MSTKSPDQDQSTVVKKRSQASFSLIETVIALGLMGTMIIEVMSVQGKAISFADFDQKVSRAVWLAKGIMSHVEYKWKFYDLKDIKVSDREEQFPEELCPKQDSQDCEFTYKLSIREWKLPLIDLLVGGGGDDNPMADMIKQQAKNILGDEVLKVAHVEVFWPEGSKRNSVDLTYLLTAQNKLDQYIESLSPINGCKPEEVLDKQGKCVKKKKKGPPSQEEEGDTDDDDNP